MAPEETPRKEGMYTQKEAENYWKNRRHEELQQWGETVVPLLEKEDDPERDDKIQFFSFLMSAIERGDEATAALIKSLQLARLESTRSYYTGQPGSLSSEQQQKGNQYDFKTLYTLYKAGKESAGTTIS